MLAVLISVALFGFDTLTGGLVRSYARTMGTLSWSALAGAISTVDESGLLTTRRALVSENDALKDEIALREEHFVRFHELEAENEILRALARLAEIEEVGVSARVLSSFNVSPYGTFLIDAGKNDGVVVGSIVLTPGGFVFGSVSDVDSHTATVLSLFAPTREVEAHAGDVAFVVQGRGGGNAIAEVPRDAEVNVEDAVIIPEFGGRPAGIIGAIESASSSATQTFFIRFPANLDTLDFVYVIPHK